MLKIGENYGKMRSLGLHWFKFNLVGLLGVAVQLVMLKIFASYFGLNYLIATALAVETAVLHNFCWHKRWTWNDRPCQSAADSFQQWLRFNSTTGLISISGNLIFMKLLVGHSHLPLQLANLISISICSLCNFFISDNFVFRKKEVVAR